MLGSIRRVLKRIGPIYHLHGLLSGRRQARLARRKLTWYRKEAARRGVRVPETEDDVRALLAERLKDRGIIPKPPRQLHIFLAYHVSSWEFILPKALEPFGKVTAFEWTSLGFDQRAPDWLSRRDEMNAAMLEAFHRASREDPVDAVVGYLGGHNTAPETLEEMARAGAAVFNFCWDDKLHFPGKVVGGRYRSPAALAHVVDLNLTNAPESVVKYAVHGGLAMFWPEAAHPEFHRPYDVPFEFDVSFAGACYGWRPRFIRKLGKLGVKVECFGPAWPNGPLSDEGMVKLYSRTRINLGFAGMRHSRRLMHLKGRDFEVPMSGGLYLTQANPELALVYDVGREVVTYRDEEDCARIVKELLADPERADAIRKAGRARALREHTYEARWTKVFTMAGIVAEET